ncbi:hypothetical protein ACEPPN_002608 [Leptodophora sp. 'Broadleaf-Isolate-01']
MAARPLPATAIANKSVQLAALALVNRALVKSNLRIKATSILTTLLAHPFAALVRILVRLKAVHLKVTTKTNFSSKTPLALRFEALVKTLVTLKAVLLLKVRNPVQVILRTLLALRFAALVKTIVKPTAVHLNIRIKLSLKILLALRFGAQVKILVRLKVVWLKVRTQVKDKLPLKATITVNLQADSKVISMVKHKVNHKFNHNSRTPESLRGRSLVQLCINRRLKTNNLKARINHHGVKTSRKIKVNLQARPKFTLKVNSKPNTDVKSLLPA